MTVVPYIGTWIETGMDTSDRLKVIVVPYIGTWIETAKEGIVCNSPRVVPYIGTWIETPKISLKTHCQFSRTLYRYVD